MGSCPPGHLRGPARSSACVQLPRWAQPPSPAPTHVLAPVLDLNPKGPSCLWEAGAESLPGLPPLLPSSASEEGAVGGPASGPRQQAGAQGTLPAVSSCGSVSGSRSLASCGVNRKGDHVKTVACCRERPGTHRLAPESPRPTAPQTGSPAALYAGPFLPRAVHSPEAQGAPRLPGSPRPAQSSSWPGVKSLGAMRRGPGALGVDGSCLQVKLWPGKGGTAGSWS